MNWALGATSGKAPSSSFLHCELSVALSQVSRAPPFNAGVLRSLCLFFFFFSFSLVPKLGCDFQLNVSLVRWQRSQGLVYIGVDRSQENKLQRVRLMVNM